MKIFLQSKMISEADLQLHPERSNFFYYGWKISCDASLLRYTVNVTNYTKAMSLSINGSQLTEDW